MEPRGLRTGRHRGWPCSAFPTSRPHANAVYDFSAIIRDFLATIYDFTAAVSACCTTASLQPQRVSAAVVFRDHTLGESKEECHQCLHLWHRCDPAFLIGLIVASYIQRHRKLEPQASSAVGGRG